MMDGLMGALRGRRSVVRPDFVRMLWDAGLLRLDSPYAFARAVPHLAARGPHLGVAFLANAYSRRDRPAIIEPERSIGFRELNDRAVRVGRALRRRGVRPGDRVAVVGECAREILECVAAAQKAAAWAIVCDPALPASSLRLIFAAEQPKVVISDGGSAPAVAAAARDLAPSPALIVVGTDGSEGNEAASYEEVISGADSQEFRPNPVPQPGIRFYQPGSGPVDRRIDDLLAAGLGFLRVAPIRRDDVVLVDPMLHHPVVFDLATLTLLLGATLLVARTDGPGQLLAIAQDAGASVIVAESRRFDELANCSRGELDGFDRSRLQLVLALGPLRPQVHGRAQELLGPVVHTLFATPRTGWVAAASPEELTRRPLCAGRPLPGVGVTIRDGDGQPLPMGTPGHIHVRSDLTGAAPGGTGELGTAEIGWLDEEAFLFLGPP